MGSKPIPDRQDGIQMDDSWFNTIRAAITGNVVPRAVSDGTPTDVEASVGASSYRFTAAYISEGYWVTGDFKYHHSYGGLLPPGEGWMKCDGRTINEANYDTEHGSGHWDLYVGSSVLDGKKLINATDKYLVGAAETTQDGSGAFTTVGNPDNEVDLSHVHNWLVELGPSSAQHYFDASGAQISPVANADKLGVGGSGISAQIRTDLPGAPAVPNVSLYTDAQLDAVQNIQPESVEFQLYMRII